METFEVDVEDVNFAQFNRIYEEWKLDNNNKLCCALFRSIESMRNGNEKRKTVVWTVVGGSIESMRNGNI